MLTNVKITNCACLLAFGWSPACSIRPFAEIIRTRNVLVTVRLETSVTEVSRAMANAQTGVVVVIDGNTPAGIFSERDMVFRVVARELDPEKTCEQS